MNNCNNTAKRLWFYITCADVNRRVSLWLTAGCLRAVRRRLRTLERHMDLCLCEPELKSTEIIPKSLHPWSCSSTTRPHQPFTPWELDLNMSMYWAHLCSDRPQFHCVKGHRDSTMIAWRWCKMKALLHNIPSEKLRCFLYPFLCWHKHEWISAPLAWVQINAFFTAVTALTVRHCCINMHYV